MSLVLGRRDRRSVARFCDGQVTGAMRQHRPSVGSFRDRRTVVR